MGIIWNNQPKYILLDTIFAPLMYFPSYLQYVIFDHAATNSGWMFADICLSPTFVIWWFGSRDSKQKFIDLCPSSGPAYYYIYPTKRTLAMQVNLWGMKNKPFLYSFLQMKLLQISIQSSAVITRPDLLRYYIRHCHNSGRRWIRF